jgi:acyl carrier protein
MEQPIVDQLIQFVTDRLEVQADRDTLTASTPLFDSGLGLDSFAVVELITLIENHYGFEFSDTDFHPENFTNLMTLGTVVQRYLATRNDRVPVRD